FEVSTILNNSDGYSNDKVVLTEVSNTGNAFQATITGDGVGIITIGGIVYNLKYYASDINPDNWNIELTNSYGDWIGGARVYKNGYIAIGIPNIPQSSYLLKVSQLTNSSYYSNDKVVLKDLLNPDNIYVATMTSEGIGIITIGGVAYNVYTDVINSDFDNMWLKDSNGNYIGGRRVYKNGYVLVSSTGQLPSFNPFTAFINWIKNLFSKS
ncbi:MAG: hypothetical protein AABX54_00320, partial [Nanoarchaeota archaeon]